MTEGGPAGPVRYFVLCSDELMGSPPSWPACLRPVSPNRAIAPAPPGMQWWEFEDDEAPEALRGEKVQLLARTVDGMPQIADRVVIG